MNLGAKTSPKSIPVTGQIVHIRQRRYLVEDVVGYSGEQTLVKMTCVDDDAQGQPLEVLWEAEVDARVLETENWESLGKKGFDPADRFAAYINTLRWNSVTASDPKKFIAPFRAGIRIEPFQLEPLRKALLLPRVNLFIADDVGVGKTIEAGLVARELLLRRRVREIVVACPPSMLDQWQDELETRFGLTFQILDREYIARVRQQQGFGVNPWNTHSRFLVSQRLLVDPSYNEPLREWLGELRVGSLLILDEAHHAAPSSGAKYAIDTKITHTIRDLAPRFEHRLFLSATPHNGHSNSFSALLEILDPQRFCRGVKVRGKQHLEDVMVRRLKDDLREVSGGFPKRSVEQVDIKGLPESAPELQLSRLLDEYRKVKEQRLSLGRKSAEGEKNEKQARRAQVTAGLLISGLQQRLLSSVDAFARTLKKHHDTVIKQWETGTKQLPKSKVLKTDCVRGGPDQDDDKAREAPEVLDAEVEAQYEAITIESMGDIETSDEKSLFEKELEILKEMAEVAEAGRNQPDAKVNKLIEWIASNMCPGLKQSDDPDANKGLKWNDTRVIIFTEYDDTRRYLEARLKEAIYGTDKADERIKIFHGPTPDDERRRLKSSFNGDPTQHPIRILICTDAGREGLNFQLRCNNLFHFDVPWNPGRLEQRNGRIDRKLQPKPVVYCHYFFYVQRPEDRVLRVLVQKTQTIRKELGSLSEVLESRLAEKLKDGIRRTDVERQSREIEELGVDENSIATVKEEFEETRKRQAEIKDECQELQRLLDSSRKWIGADENRLKDALQASLGMLKAEPIKGTIPLGKGAPPAYVFPALDQRQGADPTWADTLDSLRPPREADQKFYQWRRETKPRPVVFEDPGQYCMQAVHLHLEHPLARRLLSRFSAHGFVEDDLSRACLAQSEDDKARVVLIGRLCLYGNQASRLHEELIYISALWTDPSKRKGKLTPEAVSEAKESLEVLDAALGGARKPKLDSAQEIKLQTSAPQDVQELLAHLEKRGEKLAERVKKALFERGEKEAKVIENLLVDQRKRIAEKFKEEPVQLLLGFNDEEKRQYESNRKYWGKRLRDIDKEMKTEPDRIRGIYKVCAQRVEPVGLVYLWPQKG